MKSTTCITLDLHLLEAVRATPHFNLSKTCNEALKAALMDVGDDIEYKLLLIQQEEKTLQEKLNAVLMKKQLLIAQVEARRTHENSDELEKAKMEVHAMQSHMIDDLL